MLAYNIGDYIPMHKAIVLDEHWLSKWLSTRANHSGARVRGFKTESPGVFHRTDRDDLQYGSWRKRWERYVVLVLHDFGQGCRVSTGEMSKFIFGTHVV